MPLMGDIIVIILEATIFRVVYSNGNQTMTVARTSFAMLSNSRVTLLKSSAVKGLPIFGKLPSYSSRLS